MKKIRGLKLIKVYATGGLILIAVLLVILYFLNTSSKFKEQEHVTIESGRIVDIRPIVRLCAMEIYRETPILDTINSKVIFGVQKQSGSITFDIESLPKEVKAALSPADSLTQDTLHIRMPREIIEIHEAAERGAWRVIDSKSLEVFGSSTLSTAEENQIKQKAIERTRKELYKDGTVARARREGAETLRRLAGDMTGRPIVIEGI